jgi:hypothetical protein
MWWSGALRSHEMVWPAVVDVVAAGFDRERWNLEFGNFFQAAFFFF